MRGVLLFSALLLVGCSAADDAATPAEAGAGADAGVTADADAGGDRADPSTLDQPCPADMVHVGDYCVDRYEAYVVEVDDGGVEHPHSPYEVIPAGVTVRAKNGAGAVPQGYISQVQASAACAAAGKRLCTGAEFVRACRGDDAGADYPYGGTTRVPGDCNEGKGSAMPLFFGSDPYKWTFADFNDPILNEWDGGLAPSGSYPKCVSPYGVYDCVGNLHEWGADPPDPKGHGRFRGGFYGDAEVNGHGCLYVTSAHEIAYHDYSTGFRCCADARP